MENAIAARDVTARLGLAIALVASLLKHPGKEQRCREHARADQVPQAISESNI
jgi:hypothetical protein